MEGTAHPDLGQSPEATAAATPELTPIQKYQAWLDEDDQPPKDPEAQGQTGDDAGSPPADGQPDGGTEPGQPKEEPRKFKYRANGQEHEADEARMLELASAGHDYQRNIQRLREAEAQLAADRALVDFIKANPEARQALQGVMAPRPGQQDTPSDPIQAFKAEVAREILGELAPHLAPVRDLARERLGNQVVAQVKSEYGEDADLMEQVATNFVMQLPPLARSGFVQAMSASPEAMVAGTRELFETVRPYVVALKQQQAAQQKNTTNQAPQDVKAQVQREAAKRQAPPLESAGAAAGDTGKKQALSAEKAKLLSRIKAGQIRPGDSLRLHEINDALAGR